MMDAAARPLHHRMLHSWPRRQRLSLACALPRNAHRIERERITKAANLSNKYAAIDNSRLAYSDLIVSPPVRVFFIPYFFFDFLRQFQMIIPTRVANSMLDSIAIDHGLLMSSSM